MKKVALFMFVMMFLTASLVFAANPTVAPTAKDTMTITGVIIDIMCSSAQKPDKLADFVKTHPKECALKCASSGYQIYADGKLQKFDKDSNTKIETFLKTKDSKLQVVVIAKKVGDVLSLVSIKNQPAPQPTKTTTQPTAKPTPKK